MDLDGDLSVYLGREKTVESPKGKNVKIGHYSTITEDGEVRLAYIAIKLTDEVEKR